MITLADVCRYVRSKNAGPFWITTDLFFHDRAGYERYAAGDALSPAAVAPRLGVEPGEVRRFDVPDLLVIKFSYPRQQPQGGAIERDMHGGQRFVDLLDLRLDVSEIDQA